jgi:hypothetical protein
MRALWIDADGVVANVVEYPDEMPLTDAGYRVVVAEGHESPGDHVTVVEDVKVTRRQMLTALHRVGMLETIKAAVAGSGDVELQIAFDEAQDFERTNPMLIGMTQAIGKTDAEIDAIFALAKGL